jgi:hypothetical protein
MPVVNHRRTMRRRSISRSGAGSVCSAKSSTSSRFSVGCWCSTAAITIGITEVFATVSVILARRCTALAQDRIEPESRQPLGERFEFARRAILDEAGPLGARQPEKQVDRIKSCHPDDRARQPAQPNNAIGNRPRRAKIKRPGLARYTELDER